MRRRGATSTVRRFPGFLSDCIFWVVLGEETHSWRAKPLHASCPKTLFYYFFFFQISTQHGDQIRLEVVLTEK